VTDLVEQLRAEDLNVVRHALSTATAYAEKGTTVCICFDKLRAHT